MDLVEGNTVMVNELRKLISAGEDYSLHVYIENGDLFDISINCLGYIEVYNKYLGTMEYERNKKISNLKSIIGFINGKQMYKINSIKINTLTQPTRE